jgi:hypothetical protein
VAGTAEFRSYELTLNYNFEKKIAGFDRKGDLILMKLSRKGHKKHAVVSWNLGTISAFA